MVYVRVQAGSGPLTRCGGLFSLLTADTSLPLLALPKLPPIPHPYVRTRMPSAHRVEHSPVYAMLRGTLTLL